jgi:hypothetical protein
MWQRLQNEKVSGSCVPVLVKHKYAGTRYGYPFILTLRVLRMPAFFHLIPTVSGFRSDIGTKYRYQKRQITQLVLVVLIRIQP